MKSGGLPVAPPLLRAATSAASAAGIELVTLLLGFLGACRADDGRATVAHCGTLPTGVRFGSTETCLQVMGIAAGGARRRRRRTCGAAPPV